MMNGLLFVVLFHYNGANCDAGDCPVGMNFYWDHAVDKNWKTPHPLARSFEEPIAIATISLPSTALSHPRVNLSRRLSIEGLRDRRYETRAC
jgi:hypothetical protein